MASAVSFWGRVGDIRCYLLGVWWVNRPG